MNNLGKLSIGMKIAAGFAIILALLMVVGVASYIYIAGASSGFSEYRSTARYTVNAGLIQGNMLKARIAMKDFVKSSDENDIEEFTKRYEEMLGYVEKAKELSQEPKYISKIDEIATDWQSYGDAFQGVVELVRTRNYLVNERLNELGPLARTKISEIMLSAREDGDIEAGYAAGVVNQHLLLARLYVLKFLDTNAIEDANRVRTEFDKMDQFLSLLDRELQNPERRRLLAEATQILDTYKADFSSLEDTIYSRNDIIQNQLDVIGPRIAQNNENLTLAQIERQDVIGPEVESSNTRAQTIIVIVSIIAVILGLIISVTISRSITGPIKKLAHDMIEIASGDGDLTRRSNSTQQDEIGEINRSFDLFVDKIAQLVAATRGVSDEMSQACNDINEATVIVNGKINSQAEHISSAATTIDELSCASAKMDEQGKSASQTTETARGKAEEGSASVKETLELMHNIVEGVRNNTNAMESLNDKVNSISSLIDTIDDIAQQTNLLALNAAIEAARAGELGRGFAVVADEVRNLADRTSKATAEVAESITGINEESQITMQNMKAGLSDVEKGLVVAESSGARLSEIESSSEAVSGAMTSMANSVQEQNRATTQISETMETILGLSKVSAEATDLSSKAISDLSVKSEQLQGMLSRFKLNAPDRRLTEAHVPKEIRERRVDITSSANALLDLVNSAKAIDTASSTIREDAHRRNSTMSDNQF